MMFAHKDPAEIDPIVTRRVSSGKTVERHVQKFFYTCKCCTCLCLPWEFWEMMITCCYLSKSWCWRIPCSLYFVIFSRAELTILPFLLSGITNINTQLLWLQTFGWRYLASVCCQCLLPLLPLSPLLPLTCLEQNF